VSIYCAVRTECVQFRFTSVLEYTNVQDVLYIAHRTALTFRRRIKSRLPFAGIIRRLSYSTRFQDKG